MPSHVHCGTSLENVGAGATVVHGDPLSGAAVLLVIGGRVVLGAVGGAAATLLEVGVRVGEGDAVTVSVAVSVAVLVTVCGGDGGTERVGDGVAVAGRAESPLRA
jgi:hypothetical protein